MRRPAALSLLLVLAACTGGTTDKAGAAAAPDAGRVQRLVSPDATLDSQAPDSFAITFATSKGEVEVVVRRAWAPKGADRLHWLASHGFFDGARFFRVLPGFVAQFGMSGIPAVDKAWDTRTIADDPVTHVNKRGAIVFATSGRNTRTTQLFINLANNANLDAMGFAPLGEVRRGMEAVDKLYSEYGEGAPYGSGPDQMILKRDGNRYLVAAYPRLDSIVSSAVRPLGGGK
ncbi:MAG: peptidylprolyl isomerase [Gemmatimonadetes bacterium]|nr:peptidylprolyl isomerase [Gemmatimonadota bacterium]